MIKYVCSKCRSVLYTSSLPVKPTDVLSKYPRCPYCGSTLLPSYEITITKTEV